MKQSCLIFGAQGQMGKACLAALGGVDCNTIALPKAACDITDSAALRDAFATYRPTFVINAAAFTNVDACETASSQAYAINVTAPGFIAQLCERHNATMMHISTDYVFGNGTTAPPHDETVSPCPLNYYGQSKLAGEMSIRNVLERHIILRTSWVFSPTSFNFLKTMMTLSDRLDRIAVVSDEASCPTYASDLAEAILAVLHRSSGSTPLYGTWHACGGEGVSRLDFATAIMEARARFGAPVPMLDPISQAQFGAPAQRPTDSRMSCQKFTRDFGMTIPSFRQNLDNSVREMLSSTKDHVS